MAPVSSPADTPFFVGFRLRATKRFRGHTRRADPEAEFSLRGVLCWLLGSACIGDYDDGVVATAWGGWGLDRETKRGQEEHCVAVPCTGRNTAIRPCYHWPCSLPSLISTSNKWSTCRCLYVLLLDLNYNFAVGLTQRQMVADEKGHSEQIRCFKRCAC